MANWHIGEQGGPFEDLEAFLNDAGELAQSLLEQGITGMKIWPFDTYWHEDPFRLDNLADLTEYARHSKVWVCASETLAYTHSLVQESVRAFYTGWYRELVGALPARR